MKLFGYQLLSFCWTKQRYWFPRPIFLSWQTSQLFFSVSVELVGERFAINRATPPSFKHSSTCFVIILISDTWVNCHKVISSADMLWDCLIYVWVYCTVFCDTWLYLILRFICPLFLWSWRAEVAIFSH